VESTIYFTNFIHVQTDDVFDKADIMRRTVAYGAKLLTSCSHDENGHGKHKSRSAFHTRRYSKVVEMLDPRSGDIFEQHATFDELTERGLWPDYPPPSGVLIVVM